MEFKPYISPEERRAENSERLEAERNYEDSARAVRDAGRMPSLFGIQQVQHIPQARRNYDSNYDNINWSK